MDEAARAGFSRLSAAEKSLFQLYAGQLPISPTAGSADENNAKKGGSKWGKDRAVRAELIRFLCINKVAVSLVDPHGLIVDSATIIGTLDLDFISVPFPIRCENCVFAAVPTFSNAEVRALSLSKSVAPGVNASHITVNGHLVMQEFSSDGGEITLLDCRVKGNIDFAGATVSNPDRLTESGEVAGDSGIAINADGAAIDGYVFLWHQFTSDGEVRLLGAQIAGDIDCEDATMNHPSSRKFPGRGVALNCERANIKGSVFLRKGFASTGEVRLGDVQIGGVLGCEGGNFTNLGDNGMNQDAPAFSAERAYIRGDANLSNDGDRLFRLVGKLSLIGARINGVLITDGADLRSATLDLTGASAPAFSDGGNFSWPNPNRLHLRRFVYEAIVGGTELAKDRLKWLALQPDDDFNTESYAQLAKVLLESGDDDGSRLVLETIAELLRIRGHPHWYLSPTNAIQASIGYGYKPIYSIVYSVGLGLLGWIIYRRSYLAGSIVPTDKEAYSQFRSQGTIPPHYSRLSSLMMSVENSLPLVKLGQSDKWQADPSPTPQEVRTAQPSVEMLPESTIILASPKWFVLPYIYARQLIESAAIKVGLQPTSTGRSPNSRLSRYGTSARFVRCFIWLQILLGWLFATLFVAAVGGLIKK
jgi:hypothetical protein